MLLACAVATVAVLGSVRASADEFAHKSVLNIGADFEKKVNDV